MKPTLARLLPFLLAVIAAVPALGQEPGKKRLTFEDTRTRILWQSQVPVAGWAWDGQHVEFQAGKAKRWFDPATATELDEKPKPDSVGDAATAVTYVARLHEGDVWIEPRQPSPARGERGRRGGRGNRGAPGPEAVRLSTDGKTRKRVEVHCNATGTHASFVQGGNLFVLDAAGGGEWQVTSDGSDEKLHGVLDWVYQEEVYGRGDFQGHWWSPDGDRIAVLSLDEAPVREFTLVNHVPEGFLDKERSVTTEVANYPKVGDPNPIASLSIVRVKDRKVVPVDLSKFPADVLVVRVEWTADKKHLLVTLQDRIQTWAELCAVDLETGALQHWIREQSPTWVNRPDSPRFLADGTFLWLSERTGYQHVYRYRPGGELVNAVTCGAVTGGAENGQAAEWQVRRIERIDEAGGWLWFEGTKDGATGRHVYRVGLDGKGLCCVTPGVGTHNAAFNRDGRYLVDTWSAIDRPTTVRVLDAATGAVVREMGQARTGVADEYLFATKERHTIPARDGFALDATVIRPPEPRAGALHPVYLPTYSGPDAPSVHDNWAPDSYHQFLAQQGFLVLQVNVRSASGRGMKDTGACYRRLGEQELKDLEDAVAHACAHLGGDPARVAIEGWSYGGFMAAYALTHSDKFALGIAGAGVYDWRLYDTIYTERYMRLPEDNAAGYDATSVIKAAKNLRGHLVLLHGTMDDNVHMQNTMQLIWELQKAGKQNFELMLYARSQHRLAPEVGGHAEEYRWRALRRLLDPAWKAE